MGGRLPKGWKLRELGDLVRIESGGTPSRSNAAFWGNTTPWITAKDLKTFDLADSQDRLSDAGATRAALVPENTVLVLVRGMGLFKDVPIGVTTRPMAFNQDIKALHPKGVMSARFLGYALQAQRHHLMGNVDRAGHGTGRLPTNVLEALPVPTPPIDEQRRIVAVLDACDKGIALAQSSLARATEFYKAAVQQMVLGGVRPSTAFNVMKVKRSTSKGWKHFVISDLAQEVQRVNRDHSSLPVLSSTKLRGVVFSDDYFGKQVYSANTSTYKRVRRGEFVYATNHIEEGSIGLQDVCEEGLVSPMYTVFAVDAVKVNPTFLFAVSKTETYRQIFQANTSASVDRRGSLRWKDFSKLPVFLPSLDAQNQIVEALSAVQRQVDLKSQRLGALQNQKRGLLQKLLTGEWRLTRDIPELEVADVGA